MFNSHLLQPLMAQKVAKSAADRLAKLGLSQTERATRYLEQAPRVQLDDLRDNPGARVGVSCLSQVFLAFSGTERLLWRPKCQCLA